MGRFHWSSVVIFLALLLPTGCGKQEAASTVNPATLTKEQRMSMIDANAQLSPEQKAAKRAQVEQLDQQTQAAKRMAPGMNAPAGLKH